jgi:DNA polymerase kappa
MNTDKGREKLVEEIREKVNSQTKLTCSAGVGCNKMLAKIGSDMNKPNGHFILKNDSQTIKEFIKKLDIRKIPSIGRVTESELNFLGIHKCSDIIPNITEIYISCGERITNFLIDSALGISRNEHKEDTSNGLHQSLSLSETHNYYRTKDDYVKKIKELSKRLAEKLKEQNTVGKTITLGIQNEKFNYKEKSKSLIFYIQNSDDIAKQAIRILNESWPFDKSRLIRVKISNTAGASKMSKILP